MIGLGTALRCNLPPRHVWVVLSDPAETGGAVLLVNLTTLTEDCVDDVCILGPDDYGLLTHDTTVAYSRRLEGKTTQLAAMIAKGDFSVVAPVPPATLKRILVGARQSRELSESQKRLVGKVAED